LTLCARIEPLTTLEGKPTDMPINPLFFFGAMLLTFIGIGIAIVAVRNPQSKIMRVLLAIFLLAFTAFCSIGFLHSFEPGDGAIVWRVGYGIAAIASLYGVLRLLREGSEEG